METNLVKYVITAFLIAFVTITVCGQTNVSGEISFNTTWTASNSPYIVVDTVVVLSGVTLTIEPGVVVKFENDKRLEIRNAVLKANGTISDSVRFTSNSFKPMPEGWSDIYLNGHSGGVFANFDYCVFEYAQKGIYCKNFNDYIFIKNSCFSKNEYGIYDGQWLHVDSCSFIENTNGIDITSGTFNNCIFSQNQNGLIWSYINVNSCILFDNQIGIKNCDINSMINCTVESNQFGIYSYGISGTQDIDSCVIRGNQTGIFIGSNWYNSIRNCTIDSNMTAGIEIDSVSNTEILNCQINDNYIGLIDTGCNLPNTIAGNAFENNYIGIRLSSLNENIFCNKICNNVLYDLKYTAAGNTNVANNYWCTEDSVLIQNQIFDGNDSIGLGIVNYMPIDTTQCYLCGYIEIDFIVTEPSSSTSSDGEIAAIPLSGTPPFTYLWNTIPMQTSQTATGLSAGCYSVWITDSEGCIANDSVCIFNSVKINDFENQIPFQLYPNPTSDFLILDVNESNSDIEVRIYNCLGQLEYYSIGMEGNYIINTSELLSGIYIVQLSTQEKVGSGKFIKK